jgi:hypothetical protein
VTGRLETSVRFVGPVVVKPVLPDELIAFPRRALVPGCRIDGHHVMLRGFPARSVDLAAGKRLLEDHVWSRAADPKPGWRDRLIEHLRRVYPSRQLIDRVGALSAEDPACWVHGDATVANLVRLPWGGVRWIDPLARAYVPGDPRVDLGKMLQSCWGYEAVLRGERPRWDSDLVDVVLDGLTIRDVEVTTSWLLVHLARLLRYHTLYVARAFAEILADRYGCPV